MAKLSQRATTALIGALIGVVLTLAAMCYFLHNQNTSLKDELSQTKAAQTAYKKAQEKAAQQASLEFEQKQADIDSRYDSVLAKLRDAENSRLRADRDSAQCQSERRADADRMQSDMLRAYATVARYADKIRARGLACEKILDGGL